LLDRLRIEGVWRRDDDRLAGAATQAFHLKLDDAHVVRSDNHTLLAQSAFGVAFGFFAR
jgi:hypothetical protein